MQRALVYTNKAGQQAYRRRNKDGLVLSTWNSIFGGKRQHAGMNMIVCSPNDAVFDVVCSLPMTRQFINVTWKLSIMLKGAHWTH